MRAVIETKRLTLRRWGAEDVDPYAAITADPEVMRFIGSLRTRDQAEAELGRLEEHWQRHGFGLAAVEEKESGRLAGFVGVMWLFGDPATREVEIGWRLGHEWWGRGFATEGATAMRDWAFEALRLRRLVAKADPANRASRRVMEKIGMRFDPKRGMFRGREVFYVLPRAEWVRATTPPR